MTGFINVIKPSGMSSAYAVGAVKKKFNCPCGHMGTLDPLAEGVLPIAIGKATRMFDYFLGKKKTYIAEFTFGKTTDTLDSEGIIIEGTTRLSNIAQRYEAGKQYAELLISNYDTTERYERERQCTLFDMKYNERILEERIPIWTTK